MNKDITTWTSHYQACQVAKVGRHTHAPLEEFIVPAERLSHLHVDIVGPLPPSHGFTHLITIVNRTTRWPEAIPLKETTAVDCARAFASSWISRFGIPTDMTSDRGSQFTSNLWTEVAQRLALRLHRTTAYHPQSNGLVERFHRSLKSALRARLTNDNWLDELPWMMLGLRTAPKEDLDASSAELVYGEPLTVPGEFLGAPTTPWSANTQRAQLASWAERLAPVPTSRHAQHSQYIPKDLSDARYVFIRRDGQRHSLKPLYDGPYKVINPGEKTFVIQVGTRSETISIDRLKPAHVDLDKNVIVQ